MTYESKLSQADKKKLDEDWENFRNGFIDAIMKSGSNSYRKADEKIEAYISSYLSKHGIESDEEQVVQYAAKNIGKEIKPILKQYVKPGAINSLNDLVDLKRKIGLVQHELEEKKSKLKQENEAFDDTRMYRDLTLAFHVTDIMLNRSKARREGRNVQWKYIDEASDITLESAGYTSGETYTHWKKKEKKDKD